MELKFCIVKDQKTLVRTFLGDVSLESLKESLTYVWALPDYEPSFNGIADFREGKILFSKEELSQVIQKVADDNNSLRGKVAIIVSEPLAAAMATLYGEQINNIGQVGIFCYTLEATKFLGVDPKIMDCLTDVQTVHFK